MNKLTDKKCQPCEGIGQALTKEQAEDQLSNLPEWTLAANAKQIAREYKVKNFMTAVDFIKQIAEIAESENHHPDIHLTGYRNVRIELSTHALDGLTENDLIVAAKINELEVELKK